MKTGFCILVMFLFWLTVNAQSDSVKIPAVEPEYDFLYQELFNFDPASTFGGLVVGPPFLQQKFTGLENQPFTFNFYRKIPFGTSLPTSNFSLFHPLINSFSIQTAASYRLNDKFILSGNSFSANSIYNLLPASPDLRNMNIRGASMFLQYKISKSIHIGGGVSVTNY
ncbi:MAG: hypothetical protein AB2L20_28640 [Mangrovibacterium sp.]